jgi:hypothetical protein
MGSLSKFSRTGVSSGSPTAPKVNSLVFPKVLSARNLNNTLAFGANPLHESADPLGKQVPSRPPPIN